MFDPSLAESLRDAFPGCGPSRSVGRQQPRSGRQDGGKQVAAARQKIGFKRYQARWQTAGVGPYDVLEFASEIKHAGVGGGAGCYETMV